MAVELLQEGKTYARGSLLVRMVKSETDAEVGWGINVATGERVHMSNFTSKGNAVANPWVEVAADQAPDMLQEGNTYTSNGVTGLCVRSETLYLPALLRLVGGRTIPVANVTFDGNPTGQQWVEAPALDDTPAAPAAEMLQEGKCYTDGEVTGVCVQGETHDAAGKIRLQSGRTMPAFNRTYPDGAPAHEQWVEVAPAAPAKQLTVTLTHDEDEGGWVVKCPQLGVATQGETVWEALEMAADAAKMMAEVALTRGVTANGN